MRALLSALCIVASAAPAVGYLGSLNGVLHRISDGHAARACCGSLRSAHRLCQRNCNFAGRLWMVAAEAEKTYNHALKSAWQDLHDRLYEAPWETSQNRTGTRSSIKIFDFNSIDRDISGKEASDLCDTIRDLHYAVIRMPDGSDETMMSMWNVADSFFSLTEDQKSKAGGTFRKLEGVVGIVGYTKMEDGNEFLEMRVGSSGFLPDSVDNYVDGFTLKVTESRKLLTKVAHAVASAIGARAGLEHAALLDLLDDGTNLPASSWSSTQHRLCRYNAQCDVSFEAHTDTTFLTLIPCSSVPGLEVYNGGVGWIRPEEHIGTGQAKYSASSHVIVMTGEFMQVLTGGQYPAAVHRVTRLDPAGPARLSAPLLVRAKAWRTLEPGALSTSPQMRDRLQGLRGISMGRLHSLLVHPELDT